MPSAAVLGPLESVSMQTNLRHLYYDFSLACQSALLTVCGPLLFQHAGFILRGDTNRPSARIKPRTLTRGGAAGAVIPHMRK